MQSSAKTVQEYLKELPADRRKAINAVRSVILANLPKGYEERMSYGMIGYVVPHSLYPKGYPCNPKVPLPFVNLGSQKEPHGFSFDVLLRRSEVEGGVRESVEGRGQEVRHGRGLRAVQEAGGCASGSDRAVGREPAGGCLYPPDRENVRGSCGSEGGQEDGQG